MGANMADDKKMKARVLRDFWPTGDEPDRVRAGAIIEVSTETLIDGMEKGILERLNE